MGCPLEAMYSVATVVGGGGFMVAILPYVERIIWVSLRKFVLDYLITLASVASIIYLEHHLGRVKLQKEQ